MTKGRSAKSPPVAPPGPAVTESVSEPLAGLYITATPIGNLDDLTYRAHDVLSRVDVIACEDTRVTAKLLRRHAIATPMTAYHDHNAAKVRPGLLRRLAEGQAVALVSDAGMPLISDPGYRLVKESIAAGHAVTCVPGASSVLTALVLSGLPTDRFLFAGFLANRAAARRRQLTELKNVPATLVFMESPGRLTASLADMAAILGPRPAAVLRELTKLYEQARRGPLSELAEAYRQSGPPKGEVVVVVGPPEAPPADQAAIDAALTEALSAMSLSEAADAVAKAFSVGRSAIYRRALQLSAGKDKRP